MSKNVRERLRGRSLLVSHVKERVPARKMSKKARECFPGSKMDINGGEQDPCRQTNRILASHVKAGNWENSV